jgi:hypothetical protein
VHLLLGISSIALFTYGSFLALRLLHSVGHWQPRRYVQCLVLAVPLASLGLGLVGLHHFSGRACLRNAPFWDAAVEIALPVGMGLVALGALGLGMLRLALMARVVLRRSFPAGPDLQSLADGLADRLSATRAHARLCVYDRPLALTAGVFRPTVLLSTWMVEHLDRRELEAVLAHELEHVARRDYPIMWLATVLRDAFFYLPTSWAAYRQLAHEKELVCDDLAVGSTHRPLALASALAKVWQHAVEAPGFARFGAAQPLTGASESINGRIERLLAASEPMTSRQYSQASLLCRSVPAFIGLLLLEAANVTIMLALMGCGPILLLGRVF